MLSDISASRRDLWGERSVDGPLPTILGNHYIKRELLVCFKSHAAGIWVFNWQLRNPPNMEAWVTLVVVIRFRYLKWSEVAQASPTHNWMTLIQQQDIHGSKWLVIRPFRVIAVRRGQKIWFVNNAKVWVQFRAHQSCPLSMSCVSKDKKVVQSILQQRNDHPYSKTRWSYLILFWWFSNLPPWCQ